MEKKTIYTLSSYALSFILANSGAISFKTNPELWPISLSFIANGFLILYFLSYISKINENEKEIKEIEKEINKLKQHIEINEKVLNSLRDNRLIKDIKKILENQTKK